MKTSDVLNKAADLIEGRGWSRGAKGWGSDFDDDEGRFIASTGTPLCLEGAIAAAMGLHANIGGEFGIWPDDLNVCPAAKAVRAYLEYDARWLCYWNDVEERTASEVIETLRAAALVESARESHLESVTV